MISQEEFSKKVGARIKSIRQEQGLTQLELADKMQMEKSSIARIESGRRGLRFYTIYRFSIALNVPFEEFIKGII